MSITVKNEIIRRPKAAVSSFSQNALHLRNPLVVSCWSLLYPGFGHLRLVSMAKGVFLFSGELLINTYSHLNLAIIYSFTGDFARAKQVLDLHFLLAYCGVLVFAVWDSYRVALEINKLSVLADQENDRLTPLVVTSIGVNGLEKRNPWVAAAWSILMPGTGHLYCLELVVAVFMLVGGGIIIYFSHVIPAIIYSAIGQFDQAKSVVDWQWLLNFPSFYIFSIYDSYVKTVEFNKVFNQEQAQFLRNNYQQLRFEMPM